MITLTNADVAKLQAIAQAKALERIKEQAQRGIGRAFPQPRNAAIVGCAVSEVLVQMGLVPQEKQKDVEIVVRAALQSGPLMQGSTLQKLAEKEGVYEKQGALEDNY